MPSPVAPRPVRCFATLALLLLPAAGSAAPVPAAERPQALAALQAPRPASASQSAAVGWGAVYAPVSGPAYGLAVSRASPAEAQAAAEARCRRAGEGCRMVVEFAGRCGAVAQAVDRAVLVALRPLDAAAIRATTAGAGETADAAGRAALESCGREGRGICVVVASACAGR